MKKFKIFLLLSILLCFGFALSFEVHAQGDGPKLFEVNDVLPATTQLKISWLKSLETIGTFNIKTATGYYFIRYSIEGEDTDSISIYNNNIYNYNDGFISPYTDFGGAHAYIVIDISSMSSNARTISTIDTDLDIFAWEDLNAPSGFSITFEENGGTPVTDLSGQTVLPNPLPIPSKENHTFLGWYYDSSLTNRAFPGDTLTGDIVLYAKWGSGKVFEIGDVLPQGIIRISWDETARYKMAEVFGDPVDGNQIKSNNNSFNFIEKIEANYYVGGIPVLFIPEPGYLEFYPPYTVYGGGHAYVDINTAGWDLAKRTISTVIWSEYLTSRLYWEDITPDGYTQGYLTAREYYGWEDDGYWYTAEEAWDMGNEYARGVYGYYDPITKQWLSVSEYLELYGTDKMSQTDFYNNFDKYFIPAMIIVFGGAIVLTLLKVFKGRE